MTMDDVLRECRGGVLGRPHFAAALVKKGYAKSHKDAFVRYILKARAVLCAASKGGCVPGGPNDWRSRRKSACWRTRGCSRPAYLSGLRRGCPQMGFWGIEAYHPAHTDGQCVAYVHTARQLGLYVTAGSDFHGSAKPDVAMGQEQRGGRYLAESQRVLLGGAL